MRRRPFPTFAFSSIIFAFLFQGCAGEMEQFNSLPVDSRILLISPSEIFFYDSKVESIIRSGISIEECILKIETPGFTVEESLRYYTAGLILLNYPHTPSLYDWPSSFFVSTHDKSFKIRNTFGKSHLDEVKTNLADDLNTKKRSSGL